jgi:hypothetical protein
VKYMVAFQRNSKVETLSSLFERTGNSKCYKTACAVCGLDGSGSFPGSTILVSSPHYPDQEL